jgi:hypothetical protein
MVCLLVFGSLWVMSHLNQTMMPVSELTKMQRREAGGREDPRETINARSAWCAPLHRP